MKNEFRKIQDQYASSYDRRKVCSFDIEFIDGQTKPLIHQAARFLYFIKGKAKIIVDGNVYQIKPCSFVAILPWQTTIIRDVEEPLQFYKLIYNLDFISNTMHETPSTSELVQVIKPIMDCPLVQLTKDENKTVLDILSVIKSEVGIDSLYDKQEEKELSNLYVTNKLVELLIQFKRFISKKECVRKDGESIELDNRPAIFKYIYSHIADRLTLSKIAQVFYMSESALSKYINDVTGLSFSDFTNEMRITKVIDLLTYTDLALVDIAYIVGFSDASHLSKVFSERMNLSPKEYRQIYHAKDHIFKEKERSVSYELISWINHHYSEDIRVTDASEKFNLSVVEVNRTLLYSIEKNFEEFLHYLRINKACELLLTTDLPIINIGLEVGYNTSKTFTRNFIKAKNMTPGDFRKTMILQKNSESIPDDEN